MWLNVTSGSSGKHKPAIMPHCPSSLPLMWSWRRLKYWAAQPQRSLFSHSISLESWDHRHPADIKRLHSLWRVARLRTYNKNIQSVIFYFSLETEAKVRRNNLRKETPEVRLNLPLNQVFISGQSSPPNSKTCQIPAAGLCAPLHQNSLFYYNEGGQ